MAYVAAAVAIANASKASGVVVEVKPEVFDSILKRAEKPLVVHAQGGFFSPKHKYLVSYKGFAFFTKSVLALTLPPGVEVVEAGKIWIPQM